MFRQIYLTPPIRDWGGGGSVVQLHSEVFNMLVMKVYGSVHGAICLGVGRAGHRSLRGGFHCWLEMHRPS